MYRCHKIKLNIILLRGLEGSTCLNISFMDCLNELFLIHFLVSEIEN